MLIVNDEQRFLAGVLSLDERCTSTSETRLALANLLWPSLVTGNSTLLKEPKSRVICKREAMNS